VPLRRSGSGQILELFNELLVPNMPFEPFKYLSNIVHDNGIVTFGIPINGVPNDAGIFHVVSFFIPIKNVSIFNLLLVGVIRRTIINSIIVNNVLKFLICCQTILIYVNLYLGTDLLEEVWA
jgi:hypothetical protein